MTCTFFKKYIKTWYLLVFLILNMTSLLFLSKVYAVKPDTTYVAYPNQKGLDYDSLHVVTSDHYRLKAWFCKSKDYKSKPIVVFCGGDAGNMSFYLQIVSYLNKSMDYSAFLFDYRGFGKSQKFAMDTCTLAYPQFALDADAAIDSASALAQKYHVPLIVWGVSMGASISLVNASHRKDISALIAESPYASQQSVVNTIKQISNSKKNQCLKFIEDKRLEPLENTDFLNPKMQVYILQSGGDTHIRAEDVEGLYNKLSIKNKYFFISGKSIHGSWFYDNPSIVFELLKEND